MIFSKFYRLTKSLKVTTILFRSNHTINTFQKPIMPKDKKDYIVELQKQRKRIRAKTIKYSPSHIYLQIIGHGARCEPKSVVLVTDHTHYMFNCSEGTQRLFMEHHVKLSKLEHVFLTRPTWENIGGFPGVALTIQDTGLPQIYVHGPNGTIDIIEAIDSFVNINELLVTESDTSKRFSDQTMTVDYITIKSPKKIEEDDDGVMNTRLLMTNINFYDYKISYNKNRSPSNSKRARIKPVEMKGRINDMMIFVCKIHPRAGRLDLEKCVDAGVKPGPDLGKLKSGIDITLPDGTVVRSQDVIEPAEPGPLFIVMECPNEDWMDVIIDNPAFLKYQQNTATNEDEIASYIVHFAPESVLNNSKYKEWMGKFGSDTKHLIINEKNQGFYSEAMYKMQHQLHLIHPTVFPFFGDEKCFTTENRRMKSKIESLYEDATGRKMIHFNLNKNDKPSTSSETDPQKLKSIEQTNTSLETSQNMEQNTFPVEDGLFIHRCKTLNTIHLRPCKGLDNSTVEINPKEYLKDVFAIDGLLDSLADLQTQINAKTKELGNTEEYPKLLMLGTGSSVPNKSRNTSGMLLQLDKERSIILDCGESTIAQIRKFFGDSEADRILKTIKAVYVSHLHADHHLGLIGIIKDRQKVTDEPFFLLAPQQITAYLQFYHYRFEPILKHFNLVSNRDLLLNQSILPPQIEKNLCDSLQVSNIRTTYVLHCPYAYGVAITLKDGRKICYSGDATPCEGMQKLAENCFLLIHEATMEDGLEQEAFIKHHSTISQAVNVGMKANAEFTLLTHFSQRYCKIPVLPDKDQTDLSRVGIAFDFMQISLSQLNLLPLFYPCLELMFSEFRILLDEKALKRELKKELLSIEENEIMAELAAKEQNS